jgi:cystathionine beta-lyase family protein involved in aluminum resistance
VLALLQPGQRVLCLSGPPYNSLRPTFTHLSRKGVQVEFWLDQEEPWEQSLEKLPPADAYYMQRSPGYEFRSTMRRQDWQQGIAGLRKFFPDVPILVDNCYAEFVREEEPAALGAILAGSLIKNPGGGLALGGGYVAGRRVLVETVAEQLYAPGLGKELGATEGHLRSLFQGLFFAPFAVCEALKGAVFAAFFFRLLGFEVLPQPEEDRDCIIQGILLGNGERIRAFARGIQASGPVDSLAIPAPMMLPGYAEPVIMAAGTFVTGASLELSCDAPMTPPYAIYLQGGLTFDHAYLGALRAAQEMLKAGLLP